MNSLPKNIYHHHGGGLVVLVERAGVDYRVHIPKAFPGDPLAEAIRRRDHLLNQLPRPHHNRPIVSNTGVEGISEVCPWHGNKPYTAFRVHYGRRTSRIYFGTRGGPTRSQAFERAKSLRQRMAGPLRINPLTAQLFDLAL
jgi:hypothetical protein